MKKELCALFTLLLLIAGAIGNLTHLNTLMEQISNHINYSMLYCSLDDYQAAHTETSKALELWESEEPYTHIFIRHTEIDAFSDVFFDILSAIQNREKYEAENLLRKLQHLADNMVAMESVSLGSIF